MGSDSISGICKGLSRFGDFFVGLLAVYMFDHCSRGIQKVKSRRVLSSTKGFSTVHL
jgi:hypothetical protein